MVLVYEEEDMSLGVLTEQDTFRQAWRRQFHDNMLQEGLETELEDKKVATSADDMSINLSMKEVQYFKFSLVITSG